MKKILLLFFVLALVVISGCRKPNTDNTSKETSVQTSEKSESSTSTNDDQKNTTDSDTQLSTIDDARKINPEKEVSLLRRQLYEAGINSSKMSDSEIEEYAKEAEERNTDFITYVKEFVLK